jgi:hypothetical protein
VLHPTIALVPFALILSRTTMQRDARCIHGLMPHVSLVTSNLTAFGRSRGLRSASSRRGRVRGRHARGHSSCERVGILPRVGSLPAFCLRERGRIEQPRTDRVPFKRQAPKRSTLSPDLDHLDPHQAAASPGVSAEFFTGDVTDVTYTALSLRVSAYGIS